MKVLICSCMMLYFIIFGLTSCSDDKSNITVPNKESMPKRLSHEDIDAKDRMIEEFSTGVVEAVYNKIGSPTKQTQALNLASALVENVLLEKVEKIGGWAKADTVKDGDKVSSLKENMRMTTLECIGENGLFEEEKFRERVERIAESLFPV